MKANSKPKVSVVMPSLNVAKYIRQCVDSVCNQTLKDIEIIFVDAGSTDGTLEILEEYLRADPRTKLIRSAKKSYGYQINLGFDAANGEYLGIIETDDYADPEMFEALYKKAIENDLDVVKSGFYYYYSVGGERNIPNPIVSETMAKRVFCPTTDFHSKRELTDFFNIKPTIWSALYRRSFLYKNGIRLNETPGASYQDASFNFMVWTVAQRVQLLPECFVHYRQDNEASSINSPGKVYCICDEYDVMRQFLDKHPVQKGILEPVLYRIMYDSYCWNYERLEKSLQDEFVVRFHEDFVKANTEGKLDKDYFEWFRWEMLRLVIETPDEFQRKVQCDKEGIAFVPSASAYQGKENIGRRLCRLFRKGIHSIRYCGVSYTIRRTIWKIGKKVQK